MKMLACTDGSEHSRKALEKAAQIAGGCNIADVAVIHVYEDKVEFSALPLYEVGPVTRDDITPQEVERFRKLQEEEEKKREKIMAEALEIFEKENVKARPIIKEGHPADTILTVAEKEGFDMVVLGSRGIGGLKKVLLGSVSNAVIQEAKNCSVTIVK